MFNNGFPKEWSTLRKLAWLYRTVINAVVSVLKTITGNPIHITDALAKPAQALSVKLEPIQDLHGYDNPWPAGGGKNKLPYDLANVKANNAAGTWSGSVYTQSGITFTVNDDGTIKANGTASSVVQLVIYKAYVNCPFNGYILNGCPSGGSGTTYDLRVSDVDTTSSTDTGNGQTIALTSTGKWQCLILIRSGTTVSNLVFSPMIRLASESDATFAPYSNICPISGHTDADVTRTGINVWDEETEVGAISTTTGQNTSSTARLRTKNYIPVVPNTTYYSEAPKLMERFEYGEDKAFLRYVSGDERVKNWTVSEDCYYVRFCLYSSYGTTYNHDVMLNYPSTDHDYHAYSGTTYPIPLGQTVYGGTLDVMSGKLTVDRKTVTFNGSEAWVSASKTSQAQQGYYLATNAMPKLRYYGNSIKCDKLKTFDNHAEQNYTAAEYGITGYYDYSASFPNGNWIYAKAASIVSNTAGFKQWLANNPITVSYPLATPQTIQLTPQQVELLLGENNIWSDGTMTLVYLADGNASDEEALNILLGGRYVNNHGEDEPTDREALNILLGGQR